MSFVGFHSNYFWWSPNCRYTCLQRCLESSSSCHYVSSSCLCFKHFLMVFHLLPIVFKLSFTLFKLLSIAFQTVFNRPRTFAKRVHAVISLLYLHPYYRHICAVVATLCLNRYLSMLTFSSIKSLFSSVEKHSVFNKHPLVLFTQPAIPA